MENIVIVGITIGLIGLGIAVIKSGIFQKKPNMDVVFHNHEKMIKLVIGKKSEILFQLINNKETVSINEINFCIPTKLYENVETSKESLIDYKLDICGIDHIAVTFPLNEYRLGTYGQDYKTTRFFHIFITPRELGAFKIFVVVDAKVDILTLKFPFKYMPEIKERIKYDLIVDVVDKI